MLTAPALCGLALAPAIILLGRLTGLDRDRALYPITLIVIAAYYVLFAAMGGAGGAQALTSELIAATVFVAVAIVGFRTSLWWVAAGIAAHGVFDWFVHPHLIANPGMPGFWPAFCGSIDVALGVLIAVLLLRRAIPERGYRLDRGRAGAQEEGRTEGREDRMRTRSEGRDGQFMTIVRWSFRGVVLLVLLAPLLWLWLDDRAASSLGDFYGVLGALFSGLAFAAFLWALHLQQIQIRLQRGDLRLQRKELEYTRQELRRSADAAEDQSKEMSETRKELQRTAQATERQLEEMALQRSKERIDYVRSLRPRLGFASSNRHGGDWWIALENLGGDLLEVQIDEQSPADLKIGFNPPDFRHWPAGKQLAFICSAPAQANTVAPRFHAKLRFVALDLRRYHTIIDVNPSGNALVVLSPAEDEPAPE